MDEKLYKKIRGAGALNITLGVLVMVTGLVSGILLLVNGARLLGHKSDRLI